MAKAANRLTAALARSDSWVFTLVASLAAFSTYFCMYAYRKPFAAGEFKGTFSLLGAEMELKAALVLSQILGYALSKYMGIKICSEAGTSRRALTLVGLIVAAEAALVLFGVLPGNWKVLAIFLNGLPLGMIWGLVVWYLEGRRTTEILLAAMSCSFIVSSDMVKDAGRAIMHYGGVSETWMPAVTGLCFLPLLVLSVWVLTILPPPSAADIAARERRRPMSRKDRWAFVWQFFLGMSLLCVVYFFLSAYREVRDSFSVDLLKDLHREDWQLSFSGNIIGFVLLIVMAALYLVNDNRSALAWAFVVMIAGTVMLGVGTLLYDRGAISGISWLILTGLGAYLAYVPYNTLLFERIIALTRFAGTAVFGIALADATGYTGVVLVYLYKEFAFKQMHWLAFLRGFTYFMSVTGTVCLIGAGYYFLIVVPPAIAAKDKAEQERMKAEYESTRETAEA